MAYYKEKCGPDAVDEYDAYSTYRDSYGNSCSYNNRYHNIRGTGKVNTCYADNDPNKLEGYVIHSGITELCDECLNKTSIWSIDLPDTLTKIGSSCFNKTKIGSIELPKSLVEIGHENFPKCLKYITIPAGLNQFPLDNLQECRELISISVDDGNISYKIIDGVLYNYDVTEVLLCPRTKSGQIVVPSTVKHVAEKCFQYCDKITSIVLPFGLETIGDEAFSDMKLERLIMPNSVTEVGEYCFSCTSISKVFTLSRRVTKLQNGCFYKANIPSTDFLKHIEEIGEYCFYESESLPLYLRLPKIVTIGESAFNCSTSSKYIELPSTLSFIGNCAFESTAEDLKVIFLSIVPPRLSDRAFSGIGGNCKLYVPIGTKVFYEHVSPWSTFMNIEVFQPDRDFEKKSSPVSDDIQYFRLKSIVDSFNRINHCDLKEVLHDISLSYSSVDNDKDYENAVDAIRYNRKFNPVMIPDFENEISANWTNKYKLKLLSNYVLESVSPAVLITTQDPSNSIKEGAPIEIPQIDVTKLLCSHDDRTNVEVHYSDILLQIQNQLALAKHSVKVAVSGFTNYAVFKQLKDLASQGLDIHVVINNDLVNNGGYCLNFNELIKAGVHISLVEYPHLLHHKFCIIDDNVVINGSYNWTRFSGKNYENIMIFKDDTYITESFINEFERIKENAEYKDIKAMPDYVPQRPEYDRSAFKQYITEELDAEARETSDHREKITALSKAMKLNPEYIEKINPDVTAKHGEEIKVLDQADRTAKDIVSMVVGNSGNSTSSLNGNRSSNTTSAQSNYSSGQITKGTNEKSNNLSQAVAVHEKQVEKQAMESVKASNLFMVLDVSGSMKDTYNAGHVHCITKDALSAALAISDTQKVSLWKFGDSSSFIKDISLANINDIREVQCMNAGTELNSFVTSAEKSIKDDSLVIIFTDDDGGSINEAVEGMKAKKNVFWQIIVYGGHANIAAAIKGILNISLVCMNDYASKSDSEINQILLKDYISWKTKRIK